MTIDQLLLDDISDELAGGSLNYGVFLKAYAVVHAEPLQSTEIVSTALGGEAIAIDFAEIRSDSVIEMVKRCLLYAGDDAAGPSKETLESDVLTGMIEKLVSDLRLTISHAIKVEAFTLEEGHPFYPVFWDFAFLFRAASEATIFIGASSD
ncbi:hypothetical protein [Burkholderia contaminans]|uniref:hypothetical protein n=1 Tax=Burkholderia contaminans TaxID=488447 RepID=UPI00158B521C|nr:hypothetical protein [Burkholderia contaminans]